MIPAATITAGQKYWLALLGTGGTLRFRDGTGSSSTCRSEGSSSGSLTTLPTTWQTGATWAYCNPSAYATS
jgi:hypothetical protein